MKAYKGDLHSEAEMKERNIDAHLTWKQRQLGYKDKHELDLTDPQEPVYDSDDDWYVPLDEDMQTEPRPYK